MQNNPRGHSSYKQLFQWLFSIPLDFCEGQRWNSANMDTPGVECGNLVVSLFHTSTDAMTCARPSSEGMRPKTFRGYFDNFYLFGSCLQTIRAEGCWPLPKLLNQATICVTIEKILFQTLSKSPFTQRLGKGKILNEKQRSTGECCYRRVERRNAEGWTFVSYQSNSNLEQYVLCFFFVPELYRLYQTIHATSLIHLIPHQDIVDWDMDQLDKETNETHDEETNTRCLGNFHEFLSVWFGTFFNQMHRITSELFQWLD